MGLKQMHEELKEERQRSEREQAVEQELENLRKQQQELLSVNSELMRELQLKSKTIISQSEELAALKAATVSLAAENEKITETLAKESSSCKTLNEENNCLKQQNQKLQQMAEEAGEEARKQISAVKKVCQQKEAIADEKTAHAEKLQKNLEGRIKKGADKISRKEIRYVKMAFTGLAGLCLTFCGALTVSLAANSSRFLSDITKFFSSVWDCFGWTMRQILAAGKSVASMADYGSIFYWGIYIGSVVVVLFVASLGLCWIINKFLRYCSFDKTTLIASLCGLAFVMAFERIPFNLFGCLLLFILTFMMIRHFAREKS